MSMMLEAFPSFFSTNQLVSYLDIYLKSDIYELYLIKGVFLNTNVLPVSTNVKNCYVVVVSSAISVSRLVCFDANKFMQLYSLITLHSLVERSMR